MTAARPFTAWTTSGSMSMAAAPLIELATAVVGHVDALDAVLDSERLVLRGRDALEDERDVAWSLKRLMWSQLSRPGTRGRSRAAATA